MESPPVEGLRIPVNIISPGDAESQYLIASLGHVLKLGLAELCEKRPLDPIEYLALWLRRYSVNKDIELQESSQLADVATAREEQQLENDLQKSMRRERDQLIEELDRRKQVFQERNEQLEQSTTSNQLQNSLHNNQNNDTYNSGGLNPNDNEGDNEPIEPRDDDTPSPSGHDGNVIKAKGKHVCEMNGQDCQLDCTRTHNMDRDVSNELYTIEEKESEQN